MFLSIPIHNLFHTDQSRDYRQHYLCNVLHIADYNYHHTSLVYMLCCNITQSIQGDNQNKIHSECDKYCIYSWWDKGYHSFYHTHQICCILVQLPHTVQ